MKLLKILGIPKIGEYVKDWRFWLLLWIINISGNLGFMYYVSEPISVIIIFLISFSYMIITNQYTNRLVFYSVSIWAILFIQSLYVENYSITTTLHYALQIGIAVSIVVVLKEKVLYYYPVLIYIYCIISLICFAYNLMGGVISYINIDNTTIDGGVIMRVYNPFYTQLTTIGESSLLSARNCGPFWEPGAFQGYINLAFFFDMVSGGKEGYGKRYIVYILAVISTFSTGGYIVLFFNLLYYIIYCNKSKILKSNVSRFFGITILFGLALYYYSTLSFLGDKIAINENRLIFSLDSANGSYLLFGYGYDIDSFSSSSMQSASSIYSLFRYVGAFGFVVYISYLVLNNCPQKLFYAAILFLILMNEPFMMYAFWWAVPLIIFNNNNIKQIFKNKNLKDRYL